MSILRSIVWMLPVGTMVFGASVVSGQNYPTKSVRILTNPVGGGNDFSARLIAQELASVLGQPVIVDNRPAGVIQGEIVSKAAPDGYTLLLAGANFWVGTLLQKTPYDPVKDFAPITLTTSSPNILVVHPSVAATSVKELIALAKAKPGTLNYASTSAGSSSHFAGELLKSMAGINMVRVPYKGGGPAIVALMGGEVQVAFPTIGAATPNLKSGKLRALAVTSAQRSALVPDLPTIAASGVPGYDLDSADAVFAPVKTPAAIINRLSQEIVRIVNKPEVKEKYLNTGSDVVGSTPQQLSAKMKAELAALGRVVKEAGIRVE